MTFFDRPRTIREHLTARATSEFLDFYVRSSPNGDISPEAWNEQKARVVECIRVLGDGDNFRKFTEDDLDLET